MTVRELHAILLDQVHTGDLDRTVAFLVFPDPLNRGDVPPSLVLKPLSTKLGRAYIGADGRAYHFPGDESTDVVVIAVQPWK